MYTRRTQVGTTPIKIYNWTELLNRGRFVDCQINNFLLDPFQVRFPLPRGRSQFWNKSPLTGFGPVLDFARLAYWNTVHSAVDLHQICPQKCFWIPRMGVFEMRNARQRGLLAWCSKRTYLCTTCASKSGCGYRGCGRLKLRISNTPILGIQKHSFWQIWCSGMRAWSATPKSHIFWHCAVQTSPCLAGI